MDLSNGLPYWLIKNGLPYDYPKLQQDTQAQVLILGGGISGAMIAYFLVSAGIDCVLVDKNNIGLGATSSCTGLLQYELDVPMVKLSEMIGFRQAARAYQVCAEAIEDVRYIMQKIKCDELEKCGSLYYAASRKDEALIKAEYEIRVKAGLSVEYISATEIQDMYGFKSPAAIYSQNGACVDAYKLTHSLLQYCIKKGLRVYTQTIIENINYLQEGVTATTQDGVTISADKVVNATGDEALQLINRPLVQLYSTYAVASEQTHQQSDSVWTNGCMIWNTANPYLYMRTTKDNRIVVGGRDEPYTDATSRDKLLKLKSRQLTADFRRLFPSIPIKPAFSWTGTYALTADSLPYIGSVPEVPHTFFATGFGGNCIIFSTIAAELIKDMIAGHENRDENLFSFDRKCNMPRSTSQTSIDIVSPNLS